MRPGDPDPLARPLLLVSDTRTHNATGDQRQVARQQGTRAGNKSRPGRPSHTPHVSTPLANPRRGSIAGQRGTV